MKQVIPFLFCVMMVSSCWLTGNRQAKSSGTVDAQEETVVSVMEGDVVPVEEDVEPKAEAMEEPPVLWYEKDFSLVFVKHAYVGVSSAMPQTDETVLITRVGDKAYIQTRLQGAIRKCYVYEATPEGYRNTIYEGGKVTWTHEYDNDSMTGALAYQLRKNYPVIAAIPDDYDMSQAQEGTRCGRPCWIITQEADTELGRGHLVSTLWLDKEYSFLYSVSIKGTNDLGKKVDMHAFEVTSFTDKPTAKDIPDPGQAGGGAADLKKQLEEQLKAATK